MKLSDAIEAGIKLTGYNRGMWYAERETGPCACAIGAGMAGRWSVEELEAADSGDRQIGAEMREEFPALSRPNPKFAKLAGLGAPGDHLINLVIDLSDSRRDLSDSRRDRRKLVVKYLREVGL